MQRKGVAGLETRERKKKNKEKERERREKREIERAKTEKEREIKRCKGIKTERYFYRQFKKSK